MVFQCPFYSFPYTKLTYKRSCKNLSEPLSRLLNLALRILNLKALNFLFLFFLNDKTIWKSSSSKQMYLQLPVTNHLQNSLHFSQAHLQETVKDSSYCSIFSWRPCKIIVLKNKLTKQNIRYVKVFQTWICSKNWLYNFKKQALPFTLS